VKPRTDDLLRARLALEQTEQRLPSVVAALVRDGQLIWSAGAGRASGGRTPDDNVQYRCGSITKTFVAVQVMRLRDEGRLAVTDPLERYLPGAFDGVTIAQLLAHASGIRAETAGRWWERTAGGDFVELQAVSLQPRDIAEAGPARLTRPGRRFHYSNVGFAVLGELVAQLRGKSWEQSLQEELLTPLGMTRTTVRPQVPHASGFAVHPYADLLLPEPEHHHGAMAPAGQLWTTAADLAKWMSFLGGPAAGKAADGTILLEPLTLAEMREPQAVDDRRGAPWTGAHGLGLQVWNADGVRSFGHGGSMPGFLAIMRIDEATGDAQVVMANSTGGLRPSLASDLARILDEGEPRPPIEWVPAAPAEGILDAVGAWFWGPSPFVLRARGSNELELVAEPPGGRSARFRPNGDGTWTGLDAYFIGETLRIIRGDDGKPVSLNLASFIFSRTPYDPAADIPGGVDPQGWQA
jgi:CubicO group peptidase (beta-lactamase class C family)